jgi:hypothetical protein
MSLLSKIKQANKTLKSFILRLLYEKKEEKENERVGGKKEQKSESDVLCCSDFPK